MLTMQTALLFEKGEYMVIYVDMTYSYSEKESLRYLLSKYDNQSSYLLK